MLSVKITKAAEVVHFQWTEWGIAWSPAQQGKMPPVSDGLAEERTFEPEGVERGGVGGFAAARHWVVKAEKLRF
jgi:hypothetical protein